MICLCFGDMNIYAAETQGPVIDADSLTLSTTNATVGDVITISIRITDENEIDGVYFNLVNTETNYSMVHEQMNYNETTGLYEYHLAITDQMPNGRWKVVYVGAQDTASNYKEVYDFGGREYFAITGTNADSQAPIIDASSLTISNKNVAVGDTVTISVNVVENQEIGIVRMSLENTKTDSTIYNLQMNYNGNTGLYEYQLEITSELATGQWRVYSIEAYDRAGNYDSINDFGGNEFFEVSEDTNTGIDMELPVIDVDSLTLSTSKASLGDDVTISVKVTGKEEIENVSLDIMNTDSFYTLCGQTMNYNDATELYEYHFKVDQDTLNGVWKISYLSASDKTGRTNSVTDFEGRDCFEVFVEKDTQAPVIDRESLKISRTKATVGDIVKISVKATDNTEIDKVKLSLNNLDANCNISDLQMNYNEATGFYEYSFQIENGTPDGRWKVFSITAIDKWNNYGSEHDFGEKGYFKVIGTTPDKQAPVIDRDSFTINRTQASVGDVMAFAVKVTDNTGVDSVYLSLKNEKANYVWNGLPMTYNEATGFYEFQFEVTENTKNGQWKVESVNAYDALRNVSTEDFDGTKYFEITGTNVDSQAPVVDADSVSYSKSRVTVGDTVTVSLKVTDDRELDYVFLVLENTDTNYIPFDFYPMTYNEEAKRYEYDFKITDEMPNGHWKLSYITAFDKAGNCTHVSDFGEKFFEVTGTSADSEAPVIEKESLTFSKTHAVLGDVITISIKATDNVGVTGVSLSLENTEKNRIISYLSMTYNEISGYYEYQLEITPEIVTGYWKVSSVMAADKKSNSSTVSGFSTEFYVADEDELENVVLGNFINTENGVQISWSPVENADTYKVYRRIKNGKWVTLARGVSGTTYTDKTAETGTTYYYTVRAEKGTVLSPSCDGTKSITCIKKLEDVSIESVLNSSNGVEVKWQAVSDAKAYRVYRRLNNGKWTLLSGNTTGTSYLDKSAQSGATYYYTVRAVNDKVISPSCDQKRNITCVKQLDDVSVGTLQNTNQGVTVSWSSVSGAKAYRVYRRLSNGNWTVLTSNATGTSYLDRTAQEGIRYYYTVRALNDKLISPSCDQTHAITCVKQLPDVIVGTLQNTSQGVTVQWSSVSGAKAYRVYRRTANGSWTVLTSNATGTSYLDKTAQNGVTYYYTVRALNDKVISPSCDKKKYIVCVNKLDNVKMENLSIIATGVQVKWEKVDNAQSYRIYRRTENGKWMVLADKFIGTDYTDKTAENGTTYYYTVRAINDKVMSPSYDGSKKIKFLK